MKDIKILHIGDIHMDYDIKFRLKIEQSLNQIIEYCKSNKINAVVIPGDLTHRKQSYSNNSGIPSLLNFLKILSGLVDFIFITRGNHDEPGSISLLHKLEPNIYAYEYPVVLSVLTNHPLGVKDLLRDVESTIKPLYIVSLVPYPTKANFVTNDSIDNNNSDFIEKFEQIFELIGDVTSEFTCPKILGFHGNVVGSLLSSGQTLVSQDIMVAPRTLELAKHNYYALGHIHLRQEVKPNMVYAGGVANFNWGEIEQKSFEVIEFEDVLDHPFDNIYEYEMIQKRIMLTSSRPMVKIDAEFDSINGFYFYDKVEQTNYSLLTYEVENAEYRLRITVMENDRKLLTEEKTIQLKDVFGTDVKIEFNVIPDERESRSEEIMNCRTLLDEVEEYAKVVEFKITDSMKEKVLSIAGEEVFS